LSLTLTPTVALRSGFGFCGKSVQGATGSPYDHEHEQEYRRLETEPLHKVLAALTEVTGPAEPTEPTGRRRWFTRSSSCGLNDVSDGNLGVCML
jgi:hypothetical protein